MELWIRSQDKEILAKAENINIRSSCDEMPSLSVYYISIGNLEIAEYKTKERALEVLDEIHQRLIDLQTLEITPDFYKVCKRNLDNVYEMPKE